MSRDIRETAKSALGKYLLASTTLEESNTNDNIEQSFLYVDEKDKTQQLHTILQNCSGTAISKDNI